MSLVIWILVGTTPGWIGVLRPWTQSTEEARALMARAVEAQTPGCEPPLIRDFQADFHVSLFEVPPQGGDPLVRSGRVSEFWLQRSPSPYYRRTLSVVDGKTTTMAFNGRTSWMQEQGSPAVDLRGAAYAIDRDQLKEERHRIEEWMKLFFLARLMDKPCVVRVARQNIVMKLERGDVTIHEVVRLTTDERPLIILVGAEDHRVYGVHILQVETEPSETFLFDYHAVHERTDTEGAVVQRFLLPTRVTYFLRGRKVLEGSAEKVSDIKINSGLKAGLFNPPRS